MMHQEKIPKIYSALIAIVFFLIIGLGYLVLEQTKVINELEEIIELNNGNSR